MRADRDGDAMSDILEMIFKGCGEALTYLEVEWRPAGWFAAGFGVLAVLSLVAGLWGLGGVNGSGWFVASAVCGILAFLAIAVGYFVSGTGE
jgi:hypothetical protein